MPATTTKKNGHSLNCENYFLNEMRILEVGIHTNSIPSPAVTASFLTQTQGNKQNVRRHTASGESKRCAYCKGPIPHTTVQSVVTLRKTMVPFEDRGLCFNCLGRHKSSACQSKYRVLEISLSEMQRETSHEPLHKKPWEIAKFSQGSTIRNLASSYKTSIPAP